MYNEQMRSYKNRYKGIVAYEIIWGCVACGILIIILSELLTENAIYAIVGLIFMGFIMVLGFTTLNIARRKVESQIVELKKRQEEYKKSEEEAIASFCPYCGIQLNGEDTCPNCGRYID